MDPFTIAAIVAFAYSAYTGYEGKQQQKKAMGRQAEAQRQAQAASVSQARKADMAAREANRKTPDVGELLAFEQGFRGFGGGGQSGVDPSRLNLKRPTTTLGAP